MLQGVHLGGLLLLDRLGSLEDAKALYIGDSVQPIWVWVNPPLHWISHGMQRANMHMLNGLDLSIEVSLCFW